jgi:predicted nucleotidyltransferase
MQISKDSILTELGNQKQFLHDKYGVCNIGLFGSYAKDKANENSDIDILIEIKENHRFSLLQHAQLSNYLNDLFKVPVDVIRKRSIKSYIKDDILKEVLYA